MNESKLVAGFKLILEGLGVDVDSPHFKDTPMRAARAWQEELCSGLSEEQPQVTTFPTKVDEMVVLGGIPVRSLCAHHLLPFFGEATIAYIPGQGKLLGLSKLSRITDYWSRRPQVQEELTSQIADHLAELVVKWTAGPTMDPIATSSGGVGVIIKARHMCMELRGVNHRGEMITSALRGVFLTKPEARIEFLQLVRT